ncbi:serine hydroxymethyltransferase [Candidatus Saccharibacteria bacterium]|jgi:glycine hydroxymethyltransferase|nr:serine hydroxymethyltransferase [Candidatus Saccharibacteria bacterium]HPW48060.1 serine hydroxymethyltransferase [Candidatus Saccharibacteria bacterium]
MLRDQKLNFLLKAEEKRQITGLELIPSENYVSKDVLNALGSVFTNKYSEGYPGKRYYGGQQNTDQVENTAIDLAKKLFRADHANVQLHSGAQANECVYHSWLDLGDTIMAMDLSHGGHLTHGHPNTILARQYRFITYKIKDLETGSLDYDQMLRSAKKYKPKIILAGFSSFPRNLDYAKFVEIGRQVGAVLVADIAHLAGLIAGGVQENPLDFGFHVLSSTTHKTLRGPRGGLILSKGVAGNPLKPIAKKIKNLPTLIDRTVFPGVQGGPHMNTILAKAVALSEADTPEFKQYAKSIVNNASKLANELMNRGVKLVTNGTDNHLILIDVKTSFGIDGLLAEQTLDKIGLTVNKNSIPEDKLPKFAPSGIRIGTPAITTRNLGSEQMILLAEWIQKALKNTNNDKLLKNIKNSVQELAKQFPPPTI